ncbi:lipopolysaccharide biosynthesis protein [Auraticoccus monumenti]|uniref:Polysaccharide transporter, PST family n=1 Tax=Auraticoccus monumenti TaxID=675864 RepID=A0A1G6VVI2_9ACTN|nr:lipopolysaccharide biosynthesis protein [Auraticoccus monumenti]SDD56815.1 polysaccharide transporter, PST family [Auraticoccus monumenti]
MTPADDGRAGGGGPAEPPGTAATSTDGPAADPGALRASTARGTKVVMLGQVVRILIQTASVVVLARILAPTDYGYFALALAVVSLGEVLRDFGLSTAAIQAKTLSRGQQSNLLWINLGMGLVLATICFTAAPLLGRVDGYGEAASLLRVMAVCFVINGLLAQYRADLSRRLRFGSLALADVVGPLSGLVAAVATALAGGGYWALAAQQVGGLLVTTTLAIVLAGWLPRLPDRSADVRPMLKFGVGMVGTQLVGFCNNNVDTLTVAWRFSPTDLGVYNRAFQLLMQTLNQLRNPTTTVALPVLARLQDGGPEADRMLLRGQAALGYTLVAGTAFAAGAASPVILVALGPQWSQAIPLFAALAAAGAFQTIGFVNYWVFVSRGLSGRLFRYSLLSLTLRVICVLVGSQWGVVGVAVGYAVAPAVALPLSYAILSRWTNIPQRALHWGSLRIVLCGAAAALTTFGAQQLLSSTPVLVQLVACLLVTVATYALATLVPAVRRDVQGVLAFARLAAGGRRRTTTVG